MATERLPMRKIRDVLRLHAGGLSKCRIAASLGLGPTSVGEYIRRARHAELDWLPPETLSDEALERLLFPPPRKVPSDQRPQADWAAMHRELRKPGVTLSLWSEEYRAVWPDGYGHSRFRDLHRAWAARLCATMRQVHLAGDKMFVDYAGATLEVIDGITGEIRPAQVFVAVLGASSHTYAEATWRQTVPDRIAPMVGPSPSSAACPVRSSPITSSRASPKPASTSPRSIAPMPRWRAITAPP